MKRAWAAGLLAALLGACTRSPVPIQGDAGFHFDPAVVGLWKFELEDGEDCHVRIARDKGGRLMLRLSEPRDPPDPDEVMDFDLMLTRIGSQQYASLLFRNPNPPGPGEDPLPRFYDLWRYEVVSRDQVDVYYADPDRLMEAIDRKEIGGHKVEDRHLSSIELETDEPRLREFVKSHGKDLFAGRPIQLQRLE